MRIQNNKFGLIILIFVLALMSCETKQDIIPKAKNGVLDLRGLDFDKIKTITLDGEWEYFKSQLYFPKDFETQHLLKNKRIVNLPFTWKGTGYATYKLKILLDSSKQDFAFKIFTFATSYTMFVDGKEISRAGQVSKTKENAKPGMQPKVVRYTNNNKEIDIILHISNFHYRKGGFWRNIKFGKEKYIRIERENAVAQVWLIFGIALSLALFHLGLYFQLRDNKVILYYFFIVLALAIRLLFTGEFVILSFIDIDWNVLIKIEFISLFILPIAVLYYLRAVFKDTFNYNITKVFTAIIIVHLLIVVFSPVKIFSYTYLSFQFVLIALFFFFIYGLIVAIREKKEYAQLFFILTIILLLISSIDIINNYYNYYQFNLFNLIGERLIILSQAFIIFDMFFKTNEKNKFLTIKLKKANVNLENTVKQRTKELNKQNAYLKAAHAQLRKLIEYKEEVTNMIIHDLKAPISNVMFLTKSIRVKKINANMLILINNILDIQKYENKVIPVSKEQLVLSATVLNALEDVVYLIQKKNIIIINNIRNDILINADSFLTKRIFINILTNAIKHSSLNGTIKIETIERKEGFICIEITDFGSGIKKEKLLPVFKMFSNTNESNKIDTTGIGLAYCKMAVEAHGGSIKIESKPNEYTSVLFSLPLLAKKASTEKINIKKSELSFNKNEILYLKPFILELKKHEVYDSTYVNNILNRINKDYSSSVKKWFNKIDEAVNNCNQGLYRELIKHD